MTQEDKELLLRDLSARLPYGVKVQAFRRHSEEDLSIISYPYTLDFIMMSIMFKDNIEEYKPYLFPISSMTDEQLKEMQEIIGNPDEACVSVNTLGLELWLNSVGTDPTIDLDVLFKLQDWLNKNHFDYRGLIKKSLALDATNLNIY